MDSISDLRRLHYESLVSRRDELIKLWKRLLEQEGLSEGCLRALRDLHAVQYEIRHRSDRSVAVGARYG